MTGSQTNASRIRALNATIRYALWSVFRVAGRLGPAPREEVTAEVAARSARSWPRCRSTFEAGRARPLDQRPP
jgi:hypothetical protein